MRCDLAVEDAAYVLGALSPSERASYERHLAECERCRDGLTEIAVLPGLLGRLDPAAAAQLLIEDRSMLAVESLAEREMRTEVLLTAAAGRTRREGRSRRRGYLVAALTVAALLVAALLTVVLLPGSTTPSGPAMQTMTPVSDAEPLSAEVALRGTDYGTEIKMHCSFGSGSGAEGTAWTLRLYAYGPDGASEEVSSWVAQPGQDITISGVSRFTDAQLVRLDVTRADGSALLSYVP